MRVNSIAISHRTMLNQEASQLLPFPCLDGSFRMRISSEKMFLTPSCFRLQKVLGNCMRKGAIDVEISSSRWLDRSIDLFL